MPSGMPSCSSRTAWYGPAATAVMYVGSTGVGGNDQRAVSACGACASAAAGGADGAMFDITCQPGLAMTSNWNVAFRSGWSKQA